MASCEGHKQIQGEFVLRNDGVKCSEKMNVILGTIGTRVADQHTKIPSAQ